MRGTVYSQLRKVKEQLKRTRKSIDLLEGEWWEMPIPWSANESHTEIPFLKQSDSFKRLKSLDELTSRKQLLRRTNKIFDSISSIADDENVSIHRLLGLLLTRCTSNLRAVDIGKLLWNDSIEENPNFISEETALTIYVDANLGKQTYTKMRKHLKSQNCDVFPPWYKLRSLQDDLTPSLFPLVQPYVGVYFSLYSAIKLTTQQIFKCISNVIHSNYILNIKFGFDGSGGHSIFHEVGNVDTNNMILAMFCPLTLSLPDGKLIWEVNKPNSPTSQRAIMLQVGKENYESLHSLEIFNNDIRKLKEEGFQLIIKEQIVNVNVDIPAYMLDRKAANSYLGLHGSYCDLCSFSKQQCGNSAIIEEGFYIDRNIESINAIFEELSDEQGAVTRKNDDYEYRKGITQRPIASNNVISIQVLHSILRTFDFTLKLVYHLQAEVLDWREGATSIYLRFIKKAKSDIQNSIKEKTGIILDFPDGSGHGGTTTTGNVARSILFKPMIRDILLENIPTRFREDAEKCIQSLAIILRIISCSKKVNVEEYKSFCIETYLFILEKFPWVSNTPTVHKVLAHSWELIKMNDNHGLEAFSEEGLESCNKILRRIRICHSRKINQHANISDCINRLWISSDPSLNEVRKKSQTFCSNCNTHTMHSTRYCKIHTLKCGPKTSDEDLFDYFLVDSTL